MIVYGWIDDNNNRVLCNMAETFDIECYTEDPQCGGSVVYGIDCHMDIFTGVLTLNEDSKQKLIKAYKYFNKKYRKPDDRDDLLIYTEAHFSSDLCNFYNDNDADEDDIDIDGNYDDTDDDNTIEDDTIEDDTIEDDTNDINI